MAARKGEDVSEINVGDRVRFIGETWEALKTGEEGYVTKVRNVTFAPKPFAFVRFDDHDVDTFANQCDLELVASATASAAARVPKQGANPIETAWLQGDYAAIVSMFDEIHAELRASADEAQAARLAAVAEVAALRERLAAAESRVKALEVALEEIGDVVMQAQGEWSSVEEPYAPEWTLDYKGVRDVVADALKGDE